MPSWFTPLIFGASPPFFRICTFQTAEARVISVHWSWGFAVFGRQCSHLPGFSHCHTAPNGRLASIGLLPLLLALSLKTHWLLPPPSDPFGANGFQGGPLHRMLHCFALVSLFLFKLFHRSTHSIVINVSRFLLCSLLRNCGKFKLG